MNKILILDFGSQTTALIGRRIREAGVYTDIISGDTPLTDTILKDVKGIILGGSPESVYANGILPDQRIYKLDLPLLGICYGLQRMTTDLGGKVETLSKREYGSVDVILNDITKEILNSKAAAFFKAFSPKELQVGVTELFFKTWMSHGDSLSKLAPGFVQCAASKTGFPAITAHKTKPWFGLQFHPEVSHCENGSAILRAFAIDVCGCKKTWSMEKYLESAVEDLQNRVQDNEVLLLISGGVDSTVAGAMLLKALDPKNVHLMYMDTGLMRKNETEIVGASLKKLGAKNLHIIHCADEFFSALANKTQPEEKRRIIGDLFIKIQEREVARLGLKPNYLLAQGTLYTDLIESGKGVGNKAHVIKSHHNVGSPLVAAKRSAGLIIEPLDKLYKDEVRSLGILLNLDSAVVHRHPFPGPGLAVRIIGDVTPEKCRILREADYIFMEELKKRLTLDGAKTLYDDIWQAFAVLLPINSVGVAGDVRKYGQVLSLRAVTSSDGMTADVYPFPAKDLLEISTMITNSVPEIGRVCYDISSKPPATIEWE
ncbi:MAG: glutamine-hydrolyzing GMP synthase [Termitinemataceae bacterium]|nr:MAG: glutamine-hydrolyzing GMP synthase [Termitinemataceae bacterium]